MRQIATSRWNVSLATRLYAHTYAQGLLSHSPDIRAGVSRFSRLETNKGQQPWGGIAWQTQNPEGVARNQPRVQRRECNDRRATLGTEPRRETRTPKGWPEDGEKTVPQSLAKVIVHIVYSTKNCKR